MKKLISLLLIFSLCFMLASCGTVSEDENISINAGTTNNTETEKEPESVDESCLELPNDSIDYTDDNKVA